MLAVGDSTRLEIIFHTKKYKKRITKRPQIQTNEGPPDKRVEIISHITERPDSTYPIVIQPYKLDLSQFSEKIIKDKKFEIANVSDQKLELSVVGMPEGLFEIEVPKSIKPGKSGQGRLKLLEATFGDSFEKSVTIEVVGAEDKEVSRFTIPVKRSLHIAKSTPPPKPGQVKKGTP
ncbi:MAG: hypothetical protein ABII79_08260 [bacterium]